MRRSSASARRSTQPPFSMRSIMRPALARSTSSMSANSVWLAPGRRYNRVRTSHWPRVSPKSRTRRSNTVRIRRATSDSM